MGKRKHLGYLKVFKEQLSQKISVEKMILFGSRATGKPKRWSDFDLIIVSSSFNGKKFRYRPLQVYGSWDIKYPVDFICYTPKEFNKLREQITLVREAVREGIEI